MAINVFVAGATGAVGRRLVPLLRDAGHNVTGVTRSPEKAAALETLGVRAAVADVYDARALLKAMAASYPDVAIHQLTDLPQALDLSARPAEFEANARLRIEGTANLMAAASVAGAKRVVAQSVAFYYAPRPGARSETDPLDFSPQRQKSVGAVVALEDKVLNTPGIDGVVLRYGRFWGPGTWYPEPKGPGFIHVDAAAHAALLAVTRGAPGVYNVAADDGAVSIEKARRELDFDPGYRLR